MYKTSSLARGCKGAKLTRILSWSAMASLATENECIESVTALQPYRFQIEGICRFLSPCNSDI